MATMVTRTLSVTIDAPEEEVARDLADPATHPEWATDFFSGPAEPAVGGEVVVPVPRMGGPARFRVEADSSRGIFDLYLAPVGADFGPPIPVRLVRNGTGVDVLFTLARFPEMKEEDWISGLEGMARELQNLKRRHERDRG